MSRRSYHTGRTQAIREFLARHSNQAFTAREIRDAVEPGGCVNLVSATLGTLAGAGKLMRVGAGKGSVHFCWPIGMPKPARRKPAAPAKPMRAQAVRKPAAPARTRAPRKAPAPPRPAAEVAKAISGLAKAKRAPPLRRVDTNFPAALATVDHGFDPRRAASARIAADIAEFERRGGRIERLGVTRIFHHPSDCED
ncbi:MAG: hypothetical protein GX856_07025 [Gammaproteobacteria bacterium]|jgi:hypothetical protein|nr:hypothetical protein [Gammaproteobacteria bacterium]